jgi:glyoxalase family protein
LGRGSDPVRLDGIHHITCITADGAANVDFYTSVMGLRLVKKTINFDVPNAYHLYYGSEAGNPGSILTFFEYPNRAPGHAGAGMIHRILWRVRDESALDFWADRLASSGVEPDRSERALHFDDPEGLGLGLVVDGSGNSPLAAHAADIPETKRIVGFEGVRAYSPSPGSSEELLIKRLGFSAEGDGDFTLRGEGRSSSYGYDAPPPGPGLEGAGTVHHIAWACNDEDQPRWRELLVEAGEQVTEILDRKYFRSIYFREPSGVLFEIATKGPGFTVDEPLEHLGEQLSLPEWEEHKRTELKTNLTPIVNPRSRKS